MFRVFGGLLAALCLAAAAAADAEPRPARDFLSPALRAMQDDPSRHPGWLWIDEGEALWKRPPPSGRQSCQGCHGDIAGMAGAATRYPAVAEDGALLNLEARIERCRAQNQAASAFGPESEALLALSAAVAARSRGMPMSVRIDGPAAPWFRRGEALYSERQGQMNLSCGQCHDDNAGRRLRGDTISSGLGTGYPAYRLEWNTLGSLHRRLRACSLGVRAVQFPAGSPEYLALELYLAHRARGLPVETPGVRR
jgi:sulfur-oxidizing protein SoxA